MLCDIVPCGRRATRRGRCEAHYRFWLRWKRDGWPSLRLAYGAEAECVVEGCFRRPIGRGLCSTHYWQLRYGTPSMEPRRPYRRRGNVCRVAWCHRDAVVRGLCAEHKVVARHSLSDAVVTRLFDRVACSICGSEGRVGLDHQHGMCEHSETRVCDRCVRGWLCDSCNVGIARFNDDPALLLAAVDYLAGFERSDRESAVSAASSTP